MFEIGEVIDISKAYKSNQTDDEGNKLPLGSIKIRLGGQHRISGNIRHVWCRPSNFNKRAPLKYEQVLVFLGPAHSETDGVSKTNDYYYVTPINSTDDLVLHQLPKIWWRHKGSGQGSGDGPIEPGLNFPKVPKKVDNIQPFVGDDIWESRFGSSIRLGHSPQPPAEYEKTPTWQGNNLDPITIFRVKKPTSSSGGAAKYTVESLNKDDSSIYLTTGQKLIEAIPGFAKSIDSSTISTFSKPQILFQADRIVISGKKDKVIINGKDRVVVAAKTVYLQSDKHMVDLDDLMKWIKDILTQLDMLTSGTAQFATPSGPTSTATNLAQVKKLLQVDYNQKFKVPK